MAEYVAPVRADTAELRHRMVTMLGTGAAVPTITTSLGCVVTRQGVGLLTITFKENPGRFIGCLSGFFSTTMSDLKGYTVILGTPNIATFAIQVSIFNSAFAATDLIATQSLSLALM